MEISAQALAEAEKAGIKPVIIGWVRSELKSLEGCPHWQDEGPEADLEILPPYIPALDTMQPGQKITLLTWLHKSSRNVLHSAKHVKEGIPVKGVFNSRSPVRPNPIGLHDITVLGIARHAERAVIRVKALEALDGTPILDIKTSREHFLGEPSEGQLAAASARLIELCSRAAAKGLMPGFSGNASLRAGSYCLITKSGAAKGQVTESDLTRVRIDNGQVLSFGAKPSSEVAVHLEIYRRQPLAKAILHTHPASLLALGVLRPDMPLEQRLQMPVFESEAMCSRIATTARLEPGSPDLGVAAGTAAQKKNVIWLEGHGLCVWGETEGETLALSEEAEHLAGIALRLV